jgi:hypothetical protein
LLSIINLLLLQAWYGISDQELEYQVSDRVSFLRFLGFPDRAPDYATVWRFRERHYTVINTHYDSGQVRVAMLARTRFKNTFVHYLSM